MAQIMKATPTDGEKLVDFINYVFSHAYCPNDFPTSLPKFYAKEYPVADTHYMVQEEGNIKAVVAAYPMTYRVGGESLKAFGIGAVSVHPYARSKGYMKQLMHEALSDMRLQGMQLGCLSGLRQRYEYFGFTTCGTELTFTCSVNNVRHFWGKEFTSCITFDEITAHDHDALDAIYQMHCGKVCYVERPRERLFDTLATWQNRTFTIARDGVGIGYLGASKDLSMVHEICVADISQLVEIISAYVKKVDRYEVNITLSAHETKKMAELTKMAERVSISHAYNFNVLDYPSVVKAFLTLKSTYTRLPEGTFTIYIQGYGGLTITVADNVPRVYLSEEKPDFVLTHLEAMQLFFSPVSAFNVGLAGENDLAKRWFPLPLYIESNDKI